MTDIENRNEDIQQEPVAENLNETAAAEEAAVVTNEENVADTTEPTATDVAEAPVSTVYETTADILARLQEMAEGEQPISRQEVDGLKSQFYRLNKQQQEDAYKAFIDGGGNPDEYLPAPNTDEQAFKEQMAIVREKRAAQHEAEIQTLEENYQKKLAIIDKIKEILATPDEVNRFYNDFKALQQQWNDIRQVPAEKATDLWKTYQVYVEQFYDTLKLNNEFRAYDFKKNLELKTALCERAEKLEEEEDVVSAFRQLQQLHQEFREIGPVDRELRESIWTRFKTASTVINKRHQDFFEARKAQENENLEKKTAICEQVEAFDLDSLKTFADWNAVSEKIIALQSEWKTIGFAPQKTNVKIYERFRAACDAFFTRKAEFFKTVRDSLNTNLHLKQELCEKAEALQNSTEWKETTDALVALQKQWKEIGTVPKKYSDEIWKRFNTACDTFFEAKKAANSTQHTEQQENLQKKQAIIDSLAAIDPSATDEDFRQQLRDAQAQWNEIGHVPYREKENIYKAFRAQMDRLYGALNESATRRRINRFRTEVKDTDGKVRERLLRQFDILKNEIKTYENNLGFLTLSSKSKSGNALVEELNRKVDKLRADLDEIRQKIAALDEAAAEN
ncbi:MAG: DUF349 domain-containing protein [Prevotellaceae bacterium]|nr:DUF349 domain-containing protein [Prevotellaceae bacterium]